MREKKDVEEGRRLRNEERERKLAAIRLQKEKLRKKEQKGSKADAEDQETDS